MLNSKALQISGFLLGFSTLAVQGQSAVWQQCGGTGWAGPTTCVAGTVCTFQNNFYSQCIPGTSTSTPASTSVAHTSTTTSTSVAHTSTPTSISVTHTSTPVSTTGTPTTTTATPTATIAAPGKLKYVGVNIAGFDFGCNGDGSCQASAAWPPLTKYYGMDGEGQMQHFVKDDGFNTFRLPVGWQFLVNDVEGGPVVDANLAKYDDLVQACLRTGAFCIIDIHNYARWNRGIIGQGGPTDQQFADTWTTLATKYKSESKIIFGIMNEPHDVPDINRWAQTVQVAVTAIRNAGAKTQLILLPGNNWTSAETFVSNGSAAALNTVTNPDGTKTGLVFDVHKYLDVDNSGTNPECVRNNIDIAWQPLATWLRANGRQALNTETGGGNTASCVQFMCQQIAFQAANSDVILGYVGWAAGNFLPSYVLGEAPTQSGTTWTDSLLVQSCMSPKSGSQN